jgi:salicylate hydroxylase
MVPHIGQGSGQAIEDGFTLAALLADTSSAGIPDRLRLYEELRRERTSKVQALARAAGKLYRSEDTTPADRAMRLREWMAQGTWIYQFDAAKVAMDAAASLGRQA